MSKQDLQTLKGFRDFLPSKMVVRNEAIRRLRIVFEKYGFEELITPAIESQGVLLGKYGEEAEKLMYLFEDQGKRKVGLRYDLTVPLARVAATYPDLPRPFKRYQIQPVWRAENTQKGRYREFYQCDIDTIGSTSPLADAEILAVIYESLGALGFPSFVIKINSRQVLFENLKKAGVKESMWLTTLSSIDKLDKKTKEEVEKELEKKGLMKDEIEKVFANFEKAVPDAFLASVMEYANQMGVKDTILKFDPYLSRGLDYYTGPIFESVVTEPKIGSLTGGGRYDKLLKTLGGPDLPATGTTIGLDRVCDVVEELDLWKDMKKTTTSVLVTVFSKELLSKSLEIATVLRQSGVNTEVYPEENTKLEKQLKYADKKNVSWVVIIGPNEIEENKVVLKNMSDNTQEILATDEVIKKLEKL
ncbi:MAG TPA: histidine--tRNA ligase [Patescibacteria group bacterium]